MLIPEEAAGSAHAAAERSVRDARLTTWGLATFHAVATMLILLGALYAGGGLAGLLRGFNTWVGLYLFGALWAISWLGTGRALKSVAGALQRGVRPTALGIQAVSGGALWGGVSGLLFLLSLFVLSLFSLRGSLPDAPPNPEEAVRAMIAGFGLFLAFGGVAAFLVGAVIGLVFGLVDWLLLLLAD